MMMVVHVTLFYLLGKIWDVVIGVSRALLLAITACGVIRADALIFLCCCRFVRHDVVRYPAESYPCYPFSGEFFALLYILRE